MARLLLTFFLTFVSHVVIVCSDLPLVDNRPNSRFFVPLLRWRCPGSVTIVYVAGYVSVLAEKPTKR